MEEKLTTNNGSYTISEIHQQPEMWIKEFDLIKEDDQVIKTFIEKNVHSADEIILTGAGTSAFIGDTLVFLQSKVNNVRAVPTTDILTHPQSFFNMKKKVVLVSFARSGNSPESIAVVDLADSLSMNVVHIIITCNKDGELVKKSNSENTLLLLLPPETNDKSLAMTSSFTTMLLAYMLALNIYEIDEQRKFVDQICRSAARVLQENSSAIQKIAELNFSRAVFLGSGELKGIAEECHLKLQELTDGKVVCKHDSFLGFRHGPKAVIDKNTLLVYLVSSDEHVRRYEIDLIKQINQNNDVVGQVIVSSGKQIICDDLELNLNIHFDNLNQMDNEYSFIPYVIVGQLLGYYKSLELGLNPDQPSISGNIARVVEGVTIYEKNSY